MSIQIGDIDIAKEIIELRHQVIRTQFILELIVNKNMNKIALPTVEEMKQIEERSVIELSNRYPNMVKKPTS